jgi:hypothetical protein
MIAHTRDILFGGQPIDLSMKTKYLGVTIDCNLNWVASIDSMRSKIYSYIGVLRRIRHFVPVKTRPAVYSAHVHNRLCYLNVIWGTASVTKITELGRLQNKAIRYIFFEEYTILSVHTSDGKLIFLYEKKSNVHHSEFI